jgi:DNA-binding NtrC family response regulator
MANILVVDDELGIRALLSEILNDEGHHVELAENAQQARLAMAAQQPDLVLLDIWMPDTDGVTLLKEWGGAGQITMPVIMMSGHATIDTAVETTRMGAIAFLEKPITMARLLKAVEQGLNKKPAPPAAVGHGASSALGRASVQNMPYSGANPSAYGATPGPNTAPLGAAALHQPATQTSPSSGFVGQLPDGAHAAQQWFSLDLPLREARDAFEKAYFEFHLAQEGGSMTRVSERTGLERTHLYRKLKQLGVDIVRGKKPS